jgi:hypothetical protein
VPKTRAALMARRFPPPWAVEEQDAYFLVRNHNSQQLPTFISEINRAADQRRSC